MPLLVKLGICELAAGVLSGWAMIAIVERPEALKRLGVRQLGRIRQTHLDLLMQGTILVAVGAAVTSVPTWIGSSSCSAPTWRHSPWGAGLPPRAAEGLDGRVPPRPSLIARVHRSSSRLLSPESAARLPVFVTRNSPR